MASAPCEFWPVTGGTGDRRGHVRRPSTASREQSRRGPASARGSATPSSAWTPQWSGQAGQVACTLPPCMPGQAWHWLQERSICIDMHTCCMPPMQMHAHPILPYAWHAWMPPSAHGWAGWCMPDCSSAGVAVLTSLPCFQAPTSPCAWSSRPRRPVWRWGRAAAGGQFPAPRQLPGHLRRS